MLNNNKSEKSSISKKILYKRIKTEGKDAKYNSQTLLGLESKKVIPVHLKFSQCIKETLVDCSTHIHPSRLDRKNTEELTQLPTSCKLTKDKSFLLSPSISIQKKELKIQTKEDRIIRYIMLRSYHFLQQKMEAKYVSNLMDRRKSHITAMYKDMLIYEENKEVLKDHYSEAQSLLSIEITKTFKRKGAYLPKYAMLDVAKIFNDDKEEKRKNAICKLCEYPCNKSKDGTTFFKSSFINSINDISSTQANLEDILNDMKKLDNIKIDNSRIFEEDNNKSKISQKINIPERSCTTQRNRIEIDRKNIITIHRADQIESYQTQISNQTKNKTPMLKARKTLSDFIIKKQETPARTPATERSRMKIRVLQKIYSSSIICPSQKKILFPKKKSQVEGNKISKLLNSRYKTVGIEQSLKNVYPSNLSQKILYL